jgi:acyl carrier protein
MFGKQTAQLNGPLTYDSLRAWMVEDLSRRLRCTPEDIDTAKPFDALGLDSRNAVQISGALQKVVGKRLSPAVLFDHETIDDLAEYLAGELQIPGRTGGLDPVP